MPDRPPRPGASPGRPLGVLAALFLATIALRPQLVGIGPLIPAIRADLDVSFAVAGLLGTIPVLLMGLFAPLGPWVAGHIGPRRAVAACLAAVVGFGLLRPVLPGVPAVILTTIGIGVGMGTAGALLPIVVKLRAATEPALATGAYAAGIVAGSLVAAAVAIPLADALGSWRGPLLAFGLASIVSLAAWLVLLPRDSRADRSSGRPPRLPWSSGTAWMLVGIFGAQSLLYYSAVSWLPAVYTERGWSEADAGNLVAVMHLVGLVTGIGLPLVADRVGTRRSQLASVAAVAFAGFLGIVLLPDYAVAWAIVLGVGLGAIFPLVLTLPVDVAEGPAAVGATAALMLLGGYIVSSIGPVGLGLLRDATGGYGLSLWLLVLLAAGLFVTCLALTPARLRRGIGRPAVEIVAGP
ncbi:MAG TPA: MFS transporter [Clostridia bacterium]|nr:MFS transporter [Clostridia bacterium]